MIGQHGHGLEAQVLGLAACCPGLASQEALAFALLCLAL